MSKDVQQEVCPAESEKKVTFRSILRFCGCSLRSFFFSLGEKFPSAGSSCTRCGTCVRECPVQALSIQRKVYIKANRCLGCGQCKTECPSALRVEEIRVVTDVRKCRRCYCCLAACADGALKLKRNWFRFM